MINVTYFVCPNCKTHTANMQLSEKRYMPTKEQKGIFPVPTEILICPCGENQTKYDLEEVNKELLTSEATSQKGIS